VEEYDFYLLISELPYTEMNNWEIALADAVFHSIDDLIKSAKIW